MIRAMTHIGSDGTWRAPKVNLLLVVIVLRTPQTPLVTLGAEGIGILAYL